MDTTPFSTISGSRILSLDGLRGIAILLVILFHTAVIYDGNAFDVAVQRVFKGGWMGVDLFFVLSGFLITGILYDSKGGRGYFKSFYVRRFLRIFPLYYGVLALFFYVPPNLPYQMWELFYTPPGNQVYYWLFGSNYLYADLGKFITIGLSPTWSLAIEEQFYLVWPLVVALLSRKQLMRLCVIIVAAALGLRILLLFMDATHTTIYVSTPTRIDTLAMGSFVALWLRGNFDAQAVLKKALGVALALGPVTLFIAISQYRIVVESVGYTLVNVFFCSLLVLALMLPRESALTRLLTTDYLRTIGKYSYAIYLFHLPVMGFVSHVLYPRASFFTIYGSQFVSQLVFTSLVFSLTLFAAWLSWHLYEKQFLKLKRFFPYSKG